MLSERSVGSRIFSGCSAGAVDARALRSTGAGKELGLRTYRRCLRHETKGDPGCVEITVLLTSARNRGACGCLSR
ncbi:hypothetical protein SKAU_G00265620 [Synaphobranchus kaupii]|uniref:Uncharacterized protein n=1 Tax=Synaphobranchus kaupii TaxID=118154 RepID=A0A9Q1EZB5_SYNKA|nr:hypothetical protein SKAU_G00265620 [Synaphobranchus kaupii]